MFKNLLPALVLLLPAFDIHAAETSANAKAPIKVVIAGLVHGHVGGFLKNANLGSVEIVGICEPDREVVKRYQERFKLDEALFGADLTKMLEERKPQAIWAFSNTYDHLAVVEAAAPRGIHVIVEKPLAVDKPAADRMATLARQHKVHLLTNLETTWYSCLEEAHRICVREQQLGLITKIVGHFGHPGPDRVQPEFLAWLNDPKLNGGGASSDFGCYGGVITTWLLGNQRPLSVTAVFQTDRPEAFPKVDDQATLIVEYPTTQAIIQASWDWTFPRKDVEIYGRKGIIRTINPTEYDIRLTASQRPEPKTAAPMRPPHGTSVEYFAAVIRGEIDPAGSMSSLETNMIAMEIQEAARESAKTGKKVLLPK
ncbi:MAG: Gfo/Idh/MocA family protein [Prosthecobacter sp.]